jgi:hypothetical protein
MAKEPSADYRSILKTPTGDKFTDLSFPQNDALYWPDRPSPNAVNLLK